MSTRELIGYGANPPAAEWPNGARIAVSFVVNYEEGSENSILDGDPHGETVGESPSPVARGERDLANESFFEYGSRVGVWRILDMFDEYGVDATIFACALALERNPEVGREIVRRGHEVMGHGNRWEEYYKMDRDEERRAIHEAVASITRSCGERPLGWYTRYGPSVNTRELVVEEGGFVYDCNAYNDDLPYYTRGAREPVAGGALLAGGQRLRLLARPAVNADGLLRVGAPLLRHALPRGRDPPQDDVGGAALPHHRQAGAGGGAAAVHRVRAEQARRVGDAPHRHRAVVAGALPGAVGVILLTHTHFVIARSEATWQSRR